MENLKQICVMIPKDLYSDLNRKSKKNYRSLSSVIREILIKNTMKSEVEND